mgnify:CR=1 FL=1
MKLMVIGGGGREHAIIKKLKENPAVEEIYCLPGNGGIAADAVCVPEIGAKDIPAQVEFAKAHRIDYAVVAPDDPLALGAVDALTEAGVPCFGPDKKAAVIEASKAFSKDLMKKYGIPTAKYELFTDADAACAYIDSQGAPIVVKADVQGSVEAVKASLEKLSNDEVRVRVIHGGVGAINESDVMLASTSQAIIVGFNVRPDNAARDSAARANVDMRMYRVIYDAINEIEAAMKGMLAPKFREVLLGHAEVRQTYKVSGVGTVAGCYAQDGKLQRKDCQVRLVRDGIVIHEGVLASLQRFKDQAKEVLAGYECGLTIEKFNDIKEGDVVEAFTMEEIPQ